MILIRCNKKNRKKTFGLFSRVKKLIQQICLTAMKFGFESFSTFFYVFFLGRKTQKTASY